MNAVFDALSLQAAMLDVVAASHATPRLIGERQQQRLVRLLEAARAVPVYRERLGNGRLRSSDLSRMAPVTKRELMDRFDEWVAQPELKLDELRDFVSDPARAAEPYLDRYVVWESSGTSGQPGIFVQDAQAMAVYDALEALRRCAPRPLARWMDPLCLAERIAFVGATSGHFASYVSVQRLRALNPWLAGNTRSFSIQVPTPELVAALNDFAPTVLATYPTAAALLADEAGSGALRIAPREVWTGGETLSPTVRAHIAQGLDCPVRNSYGASEFFTMGWECAHGHMHLNADWVILEPVDEHQRPVPPGQPSCSVLLTNLANTVQPLIRYDLGDQVTLQAGPCGCGSPLPVIRVQGRQDDALHMAGRGGRPVTLLPMALSTVLEDDAGVFDFYLRQQDDHTLVLRLPAAGEAGQAAMDRSCTELKAFAKAQGVPGLRVLQELGLPVPRGRSGKACRIVACPA